MDARTIILTEWRKKEAALSSRWLWVADELCALLAEVLCRQRREVIMFVDAVDEAEDEAGMKAGPDILGLLGLLRNRVQDTSSFVRICASCRHYPVLTAGPGTLEIVVEESNTQDLATFVQFRLHNGVKSWNKDPEDKINEGVL